jgi:uncharacterized protein YdcH (DUF465 family)
MHRDLDDQITNLDVNHPHVDETHLHEMKKNRLAIRDELSILRRKLFEETSGRETEDWGD